MHYNQPHKILVIAVLVLSCLLPGAISFANPFAILNKKDLKALVANVTKGRVVYVDHFAGPENLTGVILKGLNKDSKKIIAWNPLGTDLLMIGRLIDSSGTDLTQSAHDYFLSESDNGDLLSFDSIEPELKFFQFSFAVSSEKSKTIHVITDPSCPHCSKLSRDMIMFKDDLTDVDIRIVPIGKSDNGVRAAAKILEYGPVLAESQSSTDANSTDVESVERNTDLIVGVFPNLKIPMILVEGTPIKNTLAALLNEVVENDF